MRSKPLLIVFLLLAVSARGADYRIAQPGYVFHFPRDYFNHPNYQTEWWYYTGNVESASGHRFGFELTFFRQGVSQQPDASPWYVHNLYMAHFAISDLSGHRYYHAERLNRSGPGIAGISEQQGLIWNGNWQARIDPPDQHLQALTDNFSLDLSLASKKPAVIQGQNGVSLKAAGPGHASHYLSLTRMLTSGSIRLNGRTWKVSGASWMDHEFFTSSLASNESGWDWVGLQLSDHTELMLYRLRRKDGSISPFSSGSFVDANGSSVFLSRTDFTMTPKGDRWTSPVTHADYPLRWEITVPRLSLHLTLTTPLPDQEFTSKFGPSYWEGSVNVNGTRAAHTLSGVGYLEMTGYAAQRGFRIP